jgi:hypothetical protein
MVKGNLYNAEFGLVATHITVITFDTRQNEERLCVLVVRVSGYTTEKYCASCEVRTEFIYVM